MVVISLLIIAPIICRGFVLGLCFVMSFLVSFVFVLLLSCGCLCSVSLPRVAVDWSEVNDCGISWLYTLQCYVFFFVVIFFGLVVISMNMTEVSNLNSALRHI